MGLELGRWAVRVLKSDEVRACRKVSSAASWSTRAKQEIVLEYGTNRKSGSEATDKRRTVDQHKKVGKKGRVEASARATRVR